MSTGQMHPGQHLIDDGLVQQLISRQFPQWAGLNVERLPSGGTVNAMYRLGNAMVVRLPLVEGGAKDVSMEQEWLPRLAPWLPVAIPEVLATGQAAEGYPWPWSVYRWRSGENPTAGALSEPVLLAKDLAGFVAAMRSITLPGAPQAYRGGHVASLDASTRAAIEELRGIPQEGVDCDAAAAIWEDTLRTPGRDGPPVWLHADLMPGNLLVDGGRLTSVIDFGCTGRGDPACDLFPAWNLLPADAREAFRETLAVDDATWNRGRGRTLSQALIALPYYRKTNPAMADNARHVIRAVLGEDHGATDPS
ncbi:aminoglycoside phosphotransferase family protein [Streptomyces sp. NPDC001339]|uniref:aminoglycoside phosphotransferase family protein n=1 Tax=Streptomyces sp. NPDC001339 TaxID=3364563 RepID=UPI0036CA9725